MDLTPAALASNRLALARLLTAVENGTAQSREALRRLFPHTGKAHLIGVTGAPGTGKSSLVNRLALEFRKLEKRVAIVAIDPSSPFTGGAVLGDRVRMRELAGDPGVFIRSMASRGALGGLARATDSVVQVFDAAGYEIVLIETVGAGQAEVDIARLAHTTMVVEAPGLGDEIQAIKAGILEIADILVVNKADRPGVENTEAALRSMLDLAMPAAHDSLHRPNGSETRPAATADDWVAPILRTVAMDGSGVSDLAIRISEHAKHLHQSGQWQARDRERLQALFDSILGDTLRMQFLDGIPQSKLRHQLGEVFARTVSPWDAVEALTSFRLG